MLHSLLATPLGTCPRLRRAYFVEYNNTLNAASIDHVQHHYDTLRADSHRLVRDFYRTLFERRPELRYLFPQDLSKLYLHFDDTLRVVVDNLGRIGTVDEPLRQLGVKHLQWGAGPVHYLVARDALLQALERASGQRWTAQLARDWRAAINEIIVTMLRAAAVETARVAQQIAEEQTNPDGSARTH